MVVVVRVSGDAVQMCRVGGLAPLRLVVEVLEDVVLGMGADPRPDKGDFVSTPATGAGAENGSWGGGQT